ncbi:hypothetical protein RYX36_028869 [Vicia faba]
MPSQDHSTTHENKKNRKDEVSNIIKPRQSPTNFNEFIPIVSQSVHHISTQVLIKLILFSNKISHNHFKLNFFNKHNIHSIPKITTSSSIFSFHQRPKFNKEIHSKDDAKKERAFSGPK